MGLGQGEPAFSVEEKLQKLCVFVTFGSTLLSLAPVSHPSFFLLLFHPAFSTWHFSADPICQAPQTLFAAFTEDAPPLRCRRDIVISGKRLLSPCNLNRANTHQIPSVRHPCLCLSHSFLCI